MSIRPGSLGHVGIHVSDLDRSIEFYRKVVGLKVTGRWGPPDRSSPACFMRIDEMHHNLVLFEMPKDTDMSGVDTGDTVKRKTGGLHHIAFEMASREDWLLAIDHVRESGAEIVSGPYVHGHEVGPERTFVGGSGSHAFYFLDPDGNRIEFYCWMMSVTKPCISAPNPDL